LAEGHPKPQGGSSVSHSFPPDEVWLRVYRKRVARTAALRELRHLPKKRLLVAVGGYSVDIFGFRPMSVPAI